MPRPGEGGTKQVRIRLVKLEEWVWRHSDFGKSGGTMDRFRYWVDGADLP